MAYRTVNPYNNQVVATFDDLTDAEAMNLLAQAQKTFESWSQMSYAERAAVCRRAAAILTERPDEFARLLTLEMGKLYNGEPGRSCAERRHLQLLRGERREVPGARAYQHGQRQRRRNAHQRPAWGDPGCAAVELPLVPAGAGGGPEPDGRQRGHGQARLQRPAGGRRLRAVCCWRQVPPRAPTPTSSPPRIRSTCCSTTRGCAVCR